MLKEILRREFSPKAMRARERRYNVVEDVKADLAFWKDYGDPAILRRVIERLEAVSDEG